MKARQKQWQLHYLGFYGESTGDIDGDFGPKSKAGTEDFQKTFGLEPADGIFGKHTRNKSKEIISAIQEVVSAYAKEPLKVDGLEEEEALVREFADVFAGEDPQLHALYVRLFGGEEVTGEELLGAEAYAKLKETLICVRPDKENASFTYVKTRE